MVHHYVAHDGFHDFTGHCSKGDGAVVGRVEFGAFLVDGCYVRFFPVEWDLPCLHRLCEDF